MSVTLEQAGISSEIVQTRRLKTHFLCAGPADGIPMLLVHGNTSSSVFWAPLMTRLARHFRVIAPDLSGFGMSDARPLNASAAVQQWADDLMSLADHLMLSNVTVMTHSMGGIIGWDLLTRYADRLDWLIQIAPGSPFGFGGTRDDAGTPCFPDFAGSGAGLANRELMKALQAGCRDLRFGPASPRHLLREVILKSGTRTPWEDLLVEGMLQTRLGRDYWPGDAAPSANWPGCAPGTTGVLNALSPASLRHLNPAEPGHPMNKPKVSWIYGSDDVLVSDSSRADIAFYGRAGQVPGWPGEEVFPLQPMIGQIRAYLQRYKTAGGCFSEHCMEDAGHSPHIEQPDEVLRIILQEGI